jgi:hypothetical protein
LANRAKAKRSSARHLSGFKLSNLETLPFYIPGIFIPASRRAKLGLPMDLNIFRICAY